MKQSYKEVFNQAGDKQMRLSFCNQTSTHVDDGYEMYEILIEHNHETLDDEEVAPLARKTLIPQKVQDKMLELNGLGVLRCIQTITFIEKKNIFNLSKNMDNQGRPEFFFSQNRNDPVMQMNCRITECR